MVKKNKFWLLLFAIIIAIIAAIGFILYNTGTSYQKKLDVESQKPVFGEEKKRVTRIRLENEEGEIIEVLPNGTLIKIGAKGTKQALIGFYSLDAIYELVDLENLDNLNSQYGNKGKRYVLTIDTNKGTKTIVVYIDDENATQPLQDLINKIEESVIQYLEPTPRPNYSPIPTLPTPSSSSLPTSSPTPSPFPENAQTNTPFKCSELDLYKSTSVSNTICTPGE